MTCIQKMKEKVRNDKDNTSHPIVIIRISYESWDVFLMSFHNQRKPFIINFSTLDDDRQLWWHKTTGNKSETESI
ncbi:MAG: hypothetical protein L0H53_05120 [Candidatus Nitrosocosmicus sp.]|nr:hypothetical protein [Candidatus Nitrosocosmicus sp.]MDN5866707.1 hypothetical protein [Candidatus Nitrosocosmicus sp.]